MYSLIKKEINTYFSSPIAYLVIGVFLSLNGLVLWVFKENFNILNAGFADLNPFFYLAPWILIFLIPAITMKSFAEEFNSGTIEILKTTPLTNWRIVMGKFSAALVLVLIALLPTLSYVYTIYKLGNPVGNLDIGSIMGSYFGLALLASVYIAIGLFTSTLSKSQIVAFMVSVLSCLFLCFAFDELALFFNDKSLFIEQFGILEHYKSVRRGVVDSRDLVYFISISFFFLFITKKQLDDA